MTTAIITGATSGMGRELARLAAADYDELWITGRRGDALTALAEELGPSRAVCLPLDLTDPADRARFQAELEERRPVVGLLVNCAGYGKIGRFDELSPADVTGQIELNDAALTALTRLTAPYLGPGARVLNMASSAAFLPQPRFAVYAASKAYVLSFSRALDREWRPGGRSVTAVCPGPVATEFFAVAESDGHSIAAYKKLFMARADVVAARAYRAAMRRRRVYCPTFGMKALRFAAKLLPHGLLLRFLG
ncbi:MAG: SDR family NAD(P)-dependent oxidoreductase [Eubacteriales bacterium]|nr:SDR family NAD(P)-dependent oxidoreductase [Eubacteriales bacterium]